MYIICRFTNTEGIENFNKVNADRGIYIHSDMVEYNLDTGAYRCKNLNSYNTADLHLMRGMIIG